MAEKTIKLNTAKALALLEEKGWTKSDWGASEHFGLLLCIAIDAMLQAKIEEPQQAKVLEYMKATFAEHTEISISSNFKKLMVDTGQVKGTLQKYF